MGPTDDPETCEVEDYFGMKMYWSYFNTKTNTYLVIEYGFDIIWYKIVTDSNNLKAHHISILA
ncbi:MAG: hypothetical protein ACFFD2_19295 [Promethearchaeota archaeon]